MTNALILSVLFAFLLSFTDSSAIAQPSMKRQGPTMTSGAAMKPAPTMTRSASAAGQKAKAPRKAMKRSSKKLRRTR